MKRTSRRLVMALALMGLAAFLVACDGGLFGPSKGVVLRGSVLGSGNLGAGGGPEGSDGLMVTVKGTNITTTVGSDGSFVLRGLPEGSFTLVFTLNGTPLTPELEFSEVKPNHEITITVKVDGTTVTVVEERRNGIGHGDVEVEGVITDLDMVEPNQGTIVVNGRTILIRPGVTAMRKGNERLTLEDFDEGDRVHVKGVWEAGQGGVRNVLAHEIKLQEEDDDDGDGNGTCMIHGGKVGQHIELEGKFESGNTTQFQFRVNGNRASGPVTVNAGSASFKCTPAGGPNAPTPDQCKAKATSSGAKLHVRGTLTSCSASAAVVDATEVRVQGK